MLDIEEEQVELFSECLNDVKNNIHKCENCNTLTENELCYICSDDTRDNNVLCVVDDCKSVFLFEKLGMFNGKYHVLDGLISPLDGINPEDIGIDKLLILSGYILTPKINLECYQIYPSLIQSFYLFFY